LTTSKISCYYPFTSKCIYLNDVFFWADTRGGGTITLQDFHGHGDGFHVKSRLLTIMCQCVRVKRWTKTTKHYDTNTNSQNSPFLPVNFARQNIENLFRGKGNPSWLYQKSLSRHGKVLFRWNSTYIIIWHRYVNEQWCYSWDCYIEIFWTHGFFGSNNSRCQKCLYLWISRDTVPTSFNFGRNVRAYIYLLHHTKNKQCQVEISQLFGHVALKQKCYFHSSCRPKTYF
jgi:hypothetical protein